MKNQSKKIITQNDIKQTITVKSYIRKDIIVNGYERKRSLHQIECLQSRLKIYNYQQKQKIENFVPKGVFKPC